MSLASAGKTSEEEGEDAYCLTEESVEDFVRQVVGESSGFSLDKQ